MLFGKSLFENVSLFENAIVLAKKYKRILQRRRHKYKRYFHDYPYVKKYNK